MSPKYGAIPYEVLQDNLFCPEKFVWQLHYQPNMTENKSHFDANNIYE